MRYFPPDSNFLSAHLTLFHNWLKWFLKQVVAACTESAGTVERVLHKARLWMHHSKSGFNVPAQGTQHVARGRTRWICRRTDQQEVRTPHSHKSRYCAA
jgi:hypothetical protein